MIVMKTKTIQYQPEYHLYSDDELFQLIKADVTSAYRELVKRWSKKLYGKTYKYVQNPHLASKLVKQIFIELWEYRDMLLISKVSDYFSGCLKSKVYVLYEREILSYGIAEPINHFAISILKTEQAQSIDDVKILIEEWLKLQPAERVQIFSLKYKVKFTSKEIGEKLGIPLKRVQEELNNSRISLRKYIDQAIGLSILPQVI